MKIDMKADLANETGHGASETSLLAPRPGEVVHLGPGDDTFMGGRGPDTIFGQAGDDTIDGAQGADVLHGGAGDDVLYGGRGKTHLYGGLGDDQLLGDGHRNNYWAGKGADGVFLEVGSKDVVHYNSVDGSCDAFGIDFMTPFQTGEDILDLNKIDADTNTPEDDTFKFIGEHEFSGKAGELRREGDFLYGDVNGDGAADFILKVGPFEINDADILK